MLVSTPLQQHMGTAPCALLPPNHACHILRQSIVERQVLEHSCSHAVAVWQRMLLPYWVKPSRHHHGAGPELLAHASNTVTMTAHVKPTTRAVTQCNTYTRCNGHVRSCVAPHTCVASQSYLTTIIMLPVHLSQCFCNLIRARTQVQVCFQQQLNIIGNHTSWL
uniref:Uncharacterized protein n=1 Tax=Chlamydomonas leiostraca TaxID=1034604 RepID=A0A7S0WKW2_9CHLO